MERSRRRKTTVPPTDTSFSNQREYSEPTPESDAESGYSRQSIRSDRSKDFEIDFRSAVERSPQGSECSSGYGSFRSNRSKDADYDFDSRPPFTPESLRNMYEKLIQSQKEVLRQREDLLRQREDLIRQQEAVHQQEYLLRQREDSLRQQVVQQENQGAQRKINAVGDEQNLNCGTTHSCELKRSDLKVEEEKLHQRDDLNQVEREIADVKCRIYHIEATHQQKRFENRPRWMTEEFQATRPRGMAEEFQATRPRWMAEEFQATRPRWMVEEFQATRFVPDEKEELKSFKERRGDMDKELQTTRSDLKKKEEELKSFKDRVALDVAPSIKTGNTMNLNSPVSKNRIREMYETLRCDWPKIKKDLKSTRENPDSVQQMIQEQFNSARTDMEEKKVMISNVYELDKFRHGTESPEVKEYFLLAIQNLQLVIYNQKYGNGSQKPLSAHEVTNPQHMMEYLSSECYWLGCLMALNNPPINPDWENHPESMDRWNILPRNITSASEKK